MVKDDARVEGKISVEPKESVDVAIAVGVKRRGVRGIQWVGDQLLNLLGLS
jgi:hypothetical protein